MRMYGLLLAGSAIITLAGCASPNYNYMPKTTNLSFPEVDSVATARVGDELLSQGKYIESEAIEVKNQEQLGISYTVYPGHFVKQGEDDSAIYYRLSNQTGAARLEKSALADSYKAVMVDKSDNEFCVIAWTNAYVCDDDVIYKKVMLPVVAEDSFQQTLIYNGKVGDKINIGYREYQSSQARTAFSNEVEYDLSDSSTIGYKGAELEIIEATNQSIKYRVISNFN